MDQAWVEVDIKAILHNIGEAEKKLDKGVKICAIIKDNAYGHGLFPVAKALQTYGVYSLGVSDISEAVSRRKQGIKIPILNVVSALPVQVKDIVKYNINQSVSNISIIAALDKEAKKQGKTAKLHIEIDTGMGRLGVNSCDFEKFLNRTAGFKNIKIEGIFSHLASSDNNMGYTLRQISDFEFTAYCAPEGAVKHILNSSGVINFSGAAFDMVRPGLLLYGLYNNKEERKKIRLKPALAWKTRVLEVKNVKKGSSISYGNTYYTRKNTRIAVLAIGYAAGYNRLLSNRGEVLINGKKYRIAGRVCMDLTMVDLGNNAKVKAGDTAVLIGKSGKETLTAGDMAWKCRTIPYSVVCGIHKDVKRIYL